nr:c-type cytochrome [Oceanococcus sp. HetDA_MAG_MS8]
MTKGILVGSALTLATLFVGALAVSQFGLVNVAATKHDAAAVDWFLHSTYHNAVSRQAKRVVVPEGLNARNNVLVGARNFEAMCSTCHTPPGLSETPTATGMNPQPPQLLNMASHGTPAEQFWVISNGVRMTGMPAFGPTHEDDELWALVAFLQAMEGGDAEAYQSLLRDAGQTLGADDGHDHRHGPGDDEHHAMPTPSAVEDATDGHSDHAHDHAQDHEAPATAAAASGHDHDGHDHSAHDHGAQAHGDQPAESNLAPPARNAAEAAANAFYTALATGDEAAVRRLLKPDVLIFESGGAETSADEYAGGHMRSDMAFLEQATRTFIARESGIDGDRAWVATRSRLQAQLGEREIDVISTETLVMHKHAEGWQIEHVHWSSGKKEHEH